MRMKKMIMFLIFGLVLLVSISTYTIFHLNDKVVVDQPSENKEKNSDTTINEQEKTNQDQQTFDNKEFENAEIPDEQKKNEELSTFIAESHETFNQLTNYDHYKNIDWVNYEQIGSQIIEQMNTLISKSVVPSDMITDFERIEQLIKIGIRNHDETTAIYIHRILQDLDVEYNNYAQSKYGFSDYDNGGANQQTVVQYIESHKDLLTDLKIQQN